jgi:hypothetical protein
MPAMVPAKSNGVGPLSGMRAAGLAGAGPTVHYGSIALFAAGADLKRTPAAVRLTPAVAVQRAAMS